MNIEELYNRFLECDGVTTDSRCCTPNSMFIALKGANFNGNAFAAKALEKGCRYAVIDDPKFVTKGMLLVDDCLKALQQLANYHRRVLKTPVIGITGTNGKTTTKELASAVLSKKFRLLYTEGNLNNHIGVPLTLLRLRADHQLAVVEMGASHPGDIKELVDIADPDFGLITNVGRAHLQGFGSFEGVIRTKGELYDYLRTKKNARIFIQNENTYLNEIANGMTCIRYGQTPGLFVSGTVTDCSPFLQLEWISGGARHSLQTHLIGAYNADNVLAAIALGRYFGVTDEKINDAIRSYIPTNNRSMFKQTAKNKLIVDAYNANPTSMMAALQNFRLIKAEKKMVILGDMKELGESSLAEHQKIADYLSDCAFDRVMLVGTEFEQTTHPGNVCRDVEEAKAALKAQMPEDYYILVKGSNSTKLYLLPDFL